METWILTIIALRDKLSAVAKMYDERAEKEALNLTDDTLTVMERVSHYGDLKRRVVNMKVLYDRIECGVGRAQTELLKRYVKLSAADIAAEGGTNRISVYRKIKRALKKAQAVLMRLGFDLKRMDDDYNAITLCKKVRDKIRREKTKTEAEKPKETFTFLSRPDAADPLSALA